MKENILSILNELSSNNSRNFKLEVLRKNKNNGTLQKVMFLANDPLTQFYIKKIPEYTKNDNRIIDRISLETALEMLSDLSERKVTGHAGIDFLKTILASLPSDDSEVIERIIGGDLRCGVSTATINAVWPKLIRVYPVLLASGYSQKLIDKMKFPAISQLKLDGMRFNAIVKNGVCELKSRSGRDIFIQNNELYQEFVDMAKGKNVVFDGELLVVDPENNDTILERKTGNGILNKAVKNTQSESEGACVRATVWDAIPYENFVKGIDKTPYETRLMWFVGHTKRLVQVVESVMVFSQEEAWEEFNLALSLGQEGTILKSIDHPWEAKRSNHLIKFKGELECDLVVTEWNEGAGKYKGILGALTATSSDGKVSVNIGSGFSDEQRKEITRDGIIGKIISVKYNARITDINKENHSLFLPVFIEIRYDKDSADSSKDIK